MDPLAPRTTLSIIFKLHLSKPKMAFAMVGINMEIECEHFSRQVADRLGCGSGEL
jgi:hypothetical protein